MPELNTLNLPFQEAIDFFRDKVNVPTAAWDDIFGAEHDQAFMVAGAIKDDLIQDFRESIDKAISEGTGYAAFREQFGDIVKRHGWSYNGGAGWRSRVTYNTNMQGAYMAGRFNQLNQAKASRPFWRYHHSDLVEVPRPEHLAWDGLVLNADDPWWTTHYPPNGWGCRCKVFALNERDLKRRGKDGPDKAPPLNNETQIVGVRGPNPRPVTVPAGIDPGFAHAPGASRLGSVTSKRLDQISRLPAAAAGPGAAELFLTERRINAAVADFDEWVSQIERGDLKGAGIRKNIGVIMPGIKAALEGQNVELRSLGISIGQGEVSHLLAQARKGSKSLTNNMVKELPRYLAKPDAVIWDKSGRQPVLLYVFNAPGSKKGRIVIKVNYKAKGDITNTIRSGALVDVRNLKHKDMILLEGEV